MVPPCTYLLPSWQRRRFRLPCALRRCSSRRPLKVHVYRSACDVWVNDSSRLFKRSSATANSAAPWCRHARVLPRRGAAMHISAAIVATATLSIAVRSATLLFTTAFPCCFLRRRSAAIPAPTAVPLPTRRRPFKLLGSACLLATSALGRRRRCCSCHSQRQLLRHFKCQRPGCFLRRQSCRCLPRLPCHFQLDYVRPFIFLGFARVSNVCVESPTPVPHLPPPLPTFAPLQVPTAVMLLAPAVVPMPVPTAVALLA